MTYTAWITTDSTSIAGDLYEIDIFAVDETGAMTGDVAYATTGTIAAKGDDDDIVNEAHGIIRAAGWDIVGATTSVATGYIVDVERV